MHQVRDPITLRIVDDREQIQAVQSWSALWRSFLAEFYASTLIEVCRQLYGQLRDASRSERDQAPKIPLCSHAPESHLSDHALLTSAIAYCLAYEDPELVETDYLWLRLAALSHELPLTGDADASEPGLRDTLRDSLAELIEPRFLDRAWRLLDEQGELLSKTEKGSLAIFANQRPDTGDRRLDLLWYAHLAASQPLFNRRLSLPDDQSALYVIKEREDFQFHPLFVVSAERSRIGLVHGGATKIKDYVFESAKLPEVRGASALLDRLNLEDTRALFGEVFSHRQAAPTALIKAPECVIYANGGDVLALAPASKAQELADALECIYVRETLTAQCVAIAGTYSLLELQYGLNPNLFWCDDYLGQLNGGSEQEIRLLRSYYGVPKPGDGVLDDEQLFHTRKCFGELATALALKRFWRREGNEGSWAGHSGVRGRGLAHFETLPFGERCTSCDRRIASEKLQFGADFRSVCASCAVKLKFGRAQKQGWGLVFEDYLRQNPDERRAYLGNRPVEALDNIASAKDLGQIGQAARPPGFIGLVYADGNNVGALIERIRTASFYRQFAGRLFEATQAAVFTALARRLMPALVTDDDGQDLLIHPFEIVSIGGDDLILIVPADKALEIALGIAGFLERAFHDGDGRYRASAAAVQRYAKDSFQADGKPQISLSAGVVLAQENNPIFFLNDIARELLKSAKEKAKHLKKDYAGGTVDFMALKSVTMVTSSVAEFRQTALRKISMSNQWPGGDVLHLTARPYTLHELRGLLLTAKALQRADLPRSQLHHLRQDLPKGRFLSSLNYLYFTSRLSFEHSALMRAALDRAWYDLDDPVPWRHRLTKDSVHEWESVLADVAEIYDFALSPEGEE